MAETESIDQEQFPVALTFAQWDIVLHCLQYCSDYHDAKKWEWMAVCKDKKMARQIASQHEKQSMETADIHRIIEETIYHVQDAAPG